MCNRAYWAPLIGFGPKFDIHSTINVEIINIPQVDGRFAWKKGGTPSLDSWSTSRIWRYSEVLVFIIRYEKKPDMIVKSHIDPVIVTVHKAGPFPPWIRQ